MSDLDRLPPSPPLCLSRGTECIGCPFTQQGCGYLEHGMAYVSALAIKDAANEALLHEREDGREAREDQVIYGFLTKYGVKSLIRTDEAFRKELLEGYWGIVYGDARGLKRVNDDYGLEVIGNKYLRQCGNRLITEAGIRTQDCSGYAPRKKDIGMRNTSADEMVILVRDVTATQLAEIARRQASRFSPQRAIEDSRSGAVPIIMSFSHLHRSEIDLPDDHDAISVFETMLQRADELHMNRKKTQYLEMYDIVRQNAPEYGIKPPEDERAIARLFLNICCPDYIENEYERLAALP